MEFQKMIQTKSEPEQKQWGSSSIVIFHISIHSLTKNWPKWVFHRCSAAGYGRKANCLVPVWISRLPYKFRGWRKQPTHHHPPGETTMIAEGRDSVPEHILQQHRRVWNEKMPINFQFILTLQRSAASWNYMPGTRLVRHLSSTLPFVSSSVIWKKQIVFWKRCGPLHCRKLFQLSIFTSQEKNKVMSIVNHVESLFQFRKRWKIASVFWKKEKS